MGKVTSLALFMIILAVIVIEGEAKSAIECNKICRQHCQRSSPASECVACLKKCYETPPVQVRTGNSVMEYEEEKYQ
ncbi:PREDICTED: uncharacterized protein LOC109125689 [Camelina sativa]|uniref:Uncharacterized protein LOC109125689 n=1 Tax=Camelina sativa TaxID=90675 RepID=A0ABM1QA09_CAMSA|nr:PREDICTED: uncharacterized protein LOC109125689 [Camelina sativa]